jgi:hypothetical protein
MQRQKLKNENDFLLKRAIFSEPKFLTCKCCTMKTLKNILACTLVSIVACQKESVKPLSINSNTQTQNNATAHFIGEHYGGGIIFYISNNREHGLIAATEDINPTKWYNTGYITTNAFHGALWRGGLNTYLIIKAQGRPGDYAALACHRYNGGGYTDWYLPSLNELKTLYQQRVIVGGFVPQFYWSSTENGTYYGWAVFFGGDHAETFLKYAVYNVRPVRQY